MQIAAVNIDPAVVIHEHAGIDHDREFQVADRDLKISAVFLGSACICVEPFIGIVDILNVFFGMSLQLRKSRLRIVFADSLKRSFGTVTHSDRAYRAYDIREKIVFPVLFHHIGRKKRLVRPVSIRRMIRIGPGVEAVAVTGPVRRIVNGRRPDLQPVVAEILTVGLIMRAVDINSVAKNSGLSVGNVLPSG